MPSQHTSTHKANSSSKAKKMPPVADRRPGEGSSARRSGATVERDDTYGLISVIYHSLQGAETSAQYEEDARRAKNPELVSFFEQCRIEQNARALRGRRLLAQHLEGRDDEDDDDLELSRDDDDLIGGATD